VATRDECFVAEDKMARKLIVFLSLVVMAMALTGASYASAIQITLGPSTSGTITVTPGSSAVFASVTGVALQAGGLGQGTFGILNGNIPVTSMNGPINNLGPNSQAITVNIGTDVLDGSYSLKSFSNLTLGGATFTTFVGYFTVTSSTSGFASTGFPVGSTSLADFITVNGVLSSGELLPTPEPATFALVGSGLLAAAGLLRRKK
jgi:hypothetical protein